MASLMRAAAMPRSYRGRVVVMLAGLVAANLGAWAWALIAFRDFPLLLGTAALAYSFGLRHAFDADHIAAIDNVTRKLMQDGQRPAAVGLFFSLGHSSVVILATIGIATTAFAFADQIERFHGIGGMIGTAISAAFLLAIAVANIAILLAIRRTFTRLRAGEAIADDRLDLLVSGGGLLARVLRPLFRLIRRSWHMYPLGVLFGLGFDTATEIGLLGISAASASNGLPIAAILVFPALFTAAMTLMDSIDSVLMVGAYGWAFARPIRKLYYNMAITFVSVVVALLVGGIEALGLIAARLQPEGVFWDLIANLNDNLGAIGALIVAVFLASWVLAVVVYRLRGYDRLDAGGKSQARA
jgi:high-affinity nickel-transport protein